MVDESPSPDVHALLPGLASQIFSRRLAPKFLFSSPVPAVDLIMLQRGDAHDIITTFDLRVREAIAAPRCLLDNMMILIALFGQLRCCVLQFTQRSRIIEI